MSNANFQRRKKQQQNIHRRTKNRRQWLQTNGAALLGASASGWLPMLANNALAQTEANSINSTEQSKPSATKKRHCILLWMTGGPSQLDTFDMKPDHKNGGEFKEIATQSAGLKFSEHLPKLAQHSDQIAVIRSLSTKEGDHGRGTYLMRTGQQPVGPIQHPTIGSSLSKAMQNSRLDLPNFVSISPYRAFNRQAFGPGFLGPQYAPLTVGASDVYQPNPSQPNPETFAELGVDDLHPPDTITKEQATSRIELWEQLQQSFVERHASDSPITHDTVYRRALQMMSEEAAGAFDLSQEATLIREAYGKGRFGQGCLLARRLIERGVSFVEVSLGTFGGGSLGWDTHQNNFASVKSLSEELDAGWGALMTDLQDRDLLKDTTIIWMGEFGRTPTINANGGRDHYPKAWTVALAGGGIQGGQAYGRTCKDGTTVEENPVEVHDILSTLCKAVGIDPKTQNVSEQGRPIQIAEGTPIQKILS